MRSFSAFSKSATSPACSTLPFCRTRSQRRPSVQPLPGLAAVPHRQRCRIRRLDHTAACAIGVLGLIPDLLLRAQRLAVQPVAIDRSEPLRFVVAAQRDRADVAGFVKACELADVERTAGVDRTQTAHLPPFGDGRDFAVQIGAEHVEVAFVLRRETAALSPSISATRIAAREGHASTVRLKAFRQTRVIRVSARAELLRGFLADAITGIIP